MRRTNRALHAFIGTVFFLSTASIGACHLVLGIEEGTSCSGTRACGEGGQGGETSNGGSAGFGKDASDERDLELYLDATMGPRKDFPDTPIVAPSLPPDVPSLFGPDISGGAGPCLVEPPIDAMFPSNWTPPLFEWKASPGHNVFELRLRVDNQVNDLVVYTDQSSYMMPPEMWTALALSSAGHDIEVTVRSAEFSGATLVNGPFVGTIGTLHIALVPAPGSVVYWTTSGGSALKGFTIGASDVTTVITPGAMNDGTTCVGCHTSSPDGQLAFFSLRASELPFWVGGRRVDGTSGVPSSMVVSAHAAALLARTNQTLPTFSKAHYSANDAIVLTSLADASTGDRFEIAWTDLHSQSGGTGFLARVGDSRQAGTPAFSHDGTIVAYTSSDDLKDGRPKSAPTDVYIVPYNNKQGGQAKPLAGASDPSMHEYYPVFSPNDTFVAFNRAPDGLNAYNQPLAEIYVVPSNGGEPTRLAGNDPSSCSGVTSPGITNSWARWAPESIDVGDRRYYWLVFSSTRRGPLPQLFISAVVTSIASGVESIVKTYPAVYVTSQPAGEANHTPAWDVFQIQPPK
ncbi:MAG: PD40 domain-containing protein [Polyangiaceae bacterium]|nr:PD40 domain-containing protein [Polyangiaceae bacterium]